MKNLFVCAALMFCASTIIAQTRVSGIYADSLSTEPVPFATVALTPQGAQQPEQVALTEADGTFCLTTKKNGEYTLSISMMGNRPVTKVFAAGGKNIDFGKLWAVEESAEIEGVTVVAIRPMVRTEVDRIAYEVENDPDAPVKSVLDMLRKTPLVTVNGQDEITVNGSSSYSIYINDRRTSMFDHDPEKVLKTIPASSVKSIEVITAPGARYDAEGVGCIINLVMNRRSAMEGLTGTLRGEYVDHMYSSYGLNIMGQVGKLMVSSNGGFTDNDERYIQTIDQYNDNGPVWNGYRQKGKQYSDNHNGYGYLEMSYDIDSLRLITGTFNFWRGSWKGQFKDATIEMYKDGNHTNTINAQTLRHEKWGGYAFDLGYERKIGDKRTLTVLGYYHFNPYDGDGNETHYTSADGKPVNDIFRNLSSESDENTRELIVQADYVSKLTDKHHLELGAKYTHRYSGADGIANYSNPNTEKLIVSNHSILDQRQNIYAAYASYKLNLNKFNLMAGVRSETSDLSVETDGTLDNKDYGYKQTDIVPSFFMNYRISDSQNLNLNYVMRISRPGASYLNPQENENSPGYIYAGNPDLESEHYHNTSLSYNLFTQKFQFNANLTYSVSDNAIYQYMIDDPATGKVRATYGNIVHDDDLMFSFSAKHVFSEWTSLSYDGSINYMNMYSSFIDERTEGFSESFYITLEQKLFWGIKSEWWFGGRHHPMDFQTKKNSYTGHGFDLYKSFFNDRLNCSFSMQSVFQKNRNITEEKWTKTQHYYSVVDYPIRTFRIAASYRFGKLNAQLRKTSRSIDNSDLKEKSGH